MAKNCETPWLTGWGTFKFLTSANNLSNGKTEPDLMPNPK